MDQNARSTWNGPGSITLHGDNKTALTILNDLAAAKVLTGVEVNDGCRALIDMHRTFPGNQFVDIYLLGVSFLEIAQQDKGLAEPTVQRNIT